jgi:2-dehydropantoate 2-reductase
MRTLIYGAGPIGRWLALRLATTATDVTLLARNETYRSLAEAGIEIVDGLTGERHSARVSLVEQLRSDDRYDLIVVAMQKASRLAVCPILARNEHLKNVLFLGNDVSSFHQYLDHLPAETVLLGFPMVGGGWQDGDLVIMDREKPRGPHGELCFGELDGEVRARTLEVEKLFAAADIKASVERDMDGWLKYHFAFMAPTVGVIFKKGGDLGAVAADGESIHLYCQACREAGNVLRRVGYRRRQPPVFNLFYWLPRRLEPPMFSKLFNSRSAEVRIGLHAPGVGPELLEMAEEFADLKTEAEMETPTLDSLLAYVPRSAGTHRQEAFS